MEGIVIIIFSFPSEEIEVKGPEVKRLDSGIYIQF
jgi:hypothetical protein